MPHSIICPPSKESGGYDSFFFQELSPEPCSLLVEEFQTPDRCDLLYRRRRQPQQVVTDEPRRWAEVLFEPGDVTVDDAYLLACDVLADSLEIVDELAENVDKLTTKTTSLLTFLIARGLIDSDEYQRHSIRIGALIDQMKAEETQAGQETE